MCVSAGFNFQHFKKSENTANTILGSFHPLGGGGLSVKARIALPGTCIRALAERGGGAGKGRKR